MSFKALFSRSLSADPKRLHFAAHSHHLWPDASFDGHMQAWNDAARLADSKWDKVMDEVWPDAQRHVADERGTGQPDAIVFAPNTHELLLRLMAAVSESWPIRASGARSRASIIRPMPGIRSLSISSITNAAFDFPSPACGGKVPDYGRRDRP